MQFVFKGERGLVGLVVEVPTERTASGKLRKNEVVNRGQSSDSFVN